MENYLNRGGVRRRLGEGMCGQMPGVDGRVAPRLLSGEVGSNPSGNFQGKNILVSARPKIEGLLMDVFGFHALCVDQPLDAGCNFIHGQSTQVFG